MAIALDWQKRIGNQRDWVWRGWQTRYTFMRAERNPEAQRSRPPLILIHGFGAAIEHWRYNLPVLSQERDVYALDLLGFGASRKAATAYTVFLWAQQVYDFWQTFIRQPVVLVGNSIGSLVCYVAAAAYPEMVQGIAMLSLPDVSLRQEMIPKILQPLVTRVENLVASPPLLKCLFRFLRRRGVIRRWATIAYADPSAIDDELVEILAAPAYDEGAAQTFCALFQAVRQPKFAPPAQVVLPRLAVPVLLIWGTQDRMVPPSLAPFFANLNPQIHFVAIDRAGHCPQDECPDRLNPILLNWLDAHFAID